MLVETRETTKAVAFKHRLNIGDVRVEFVRYDDEEEGEEYVTNIKLVGVDDYLGWVRENFELKYSCDSAIITQYLGVKFDFTYDCGVLTSVGITRISNSDLMEVISNLSKYEAETTAGEKIEFNS